jgi:hypothetical protein
MTLPQAVIQARVGGAETPLVFRVVYVARIPDVPGIGAGAVELVVALIDGGFAGVVEEDAGQNRGGDVSATRKAPYPTNGKFGRRKQVLNRMVRTLEYRRVAYLEIASGEDRSRCGCRVSFRTHPPGVGHRDRYDG